MLKDIQSGALPVEEIPGFVLFLLKNFLLSWKFLGSASVLTILVFLFLLAHR